MPEPCRALIVAAILIIAAVRPAMSDALAERERLMQQGYFICLDRAGDEDLCLNRFGRMMWYPRDAAECKAIGARIDKILSLGGEPKWRDLFKNERCARRGMSYSVEAVTAGENAGPDTPWERCAEGFSLKENCYEKYGNHLWFPHEKKACGFPRRTVDEEIEDQQRRPAERRRPVDWFWLFKNERCWRLGYEFSEPRIPR